MEYSIEVYYLYSTGVSLYPLMHVIKSALFVWKTVRLWYLHFLLENNITLLLKVAVMAAFVLFLVVAYVCCCCWVFPRVDSSRSFHLLCFSFFLYGVDDLPLPLHYLGTGTVQFVLFFVFISCFFLLRFTAIFDRCTPSASDTLAWIIYSRC